jgi:hypothetical protein
MRSSEAGFAAQGVGPSGRLGGSALAWESLRRAAPFAYLFADRRTIKSAPGGRLLHLGPEML